MHQRAFLCLSVPERKKKEEKRRVTGNAPPLASAPMGIQLHGCSGVKKSVSASRHLFPGSPKGEPKSLTLFFFLCLFSHSLFIHSQSVHTHTHSLTPSLSFTQFLHSLTCSPYSIHRTHFPVPYLPPFSCLVDRLSPGTTCLVHTLQYTMVGKVDPLVVYRVELDDDGSPEESSSVSGIKAKNHIPRRAFPLSFLFLLSESIWTNSLIFLLSTTACLHRTRHISCSSRLLLDPWPPIRVCSGPTILLTGKHVCCLH